MAAELVIGHVEWQLIGVSCRWRRLKWVVSVVLKVAGAFALSPVQGGHFFCGAVLPPSVGDALLAGSNEPYLNATCRL